MCLNSWVSLGARSVTKRTPSQSAQPTAQQFSCTCIYRGPPSKVEESQGRRRRRRKRKINSNIYWRQLFMKKLWILKLVIYLWGTYKLEIIHPEKHIHIHIVCLSSLVCSSASQPKPTTTTPRWSSHGWRGPQHPKKTRSRECQCILSELRN